MTTRTPHVVIAGSGVGALEAALALRAFAGDLVQIDIVSPDTEFAYRAMAVAEPFGHGGTLRVPLERLERERHVHLRQDVLERVDVENRRAVLRSGDAIDYDALIVAVGAQPEAWLDGAITFSGPGSVDDVRDVLERLDHGNVDNVLFAAPAGSAWALPLYDLALLTASWCADRHVAGPRLTIATPDAQPLDIFGKVAAKAVRDMLADRGIVVRSGVTVTGYDGRRATFSHGPEIEADAVIATPRLAGNPVAGLPSDAAGFIPVGDHGEVTGAPGVYAVGDVTTHPAKQGGLAAQQADAAAAAIAHDLGHPVEPAAYHPVLRGVLLTGVTAAYLRASEEGESNLSFTALWWPPTKVAGRYLGPFLAQMASIGELPELRDRPLPEDVEQAVRDHDEVRRLAVTLARAEAEWDDRESALRWLRTVEWLDGVLPPDLAAMRERLLEH